MDFFTHEDRARAATARLLWLFFACMAAMVVLLGALTWCIAGISPQLQPNQGLLTAAVALGTAGTILIASAWKRASLGGGGQAVAELSGAQALSPHPEDPCERQLHNVVEEMSIASGTPLPRIYVLEEPAINAFAAANEPTDAAVVVSRGALTHLTRDELQGVVAHEFSHLLNGDCRMNLKLIGWAFGLLVIGLSGRVILRSLGNVPMGGDRRRGKGGGGGAIVVILLIALALIVVGYLGWWFAQLLKAGISRQREYLADASAVQFTRNPEGIGGALKKLGVHSYRSMVRHVSAQELNHLFIADAIPTPFFGLLATHPPLEARIRAIDPRWDGTWPQTAPIEPMPERSRPLMEGGHVLHPPGVTPQASHFTPAHVAFAAALMATIPPPLASAARVPYSARAVALAAVIAASGERASAQLAAIGSVDQGLGAECRWIWPAVHALGDGARLPLLNLCAGVLSQLSVAQQSAFLALVDTALAASGEPPLVEHVLRRLLRARLAEPQRAPIGAVSLAAVASDAALLLAEVAWAGAEDKDKAVAAFAAGISGVEVAMAWPEKRASASALDAAIDRIASGTIGVRRLVLTMCARCASADGAITVREAEMVRALADCFGTPLPPFLDSARQPAAATAG